jgi:hypothetical protein
MRPITLTQTGTGSTTHAVPDIGLTPFQIGMGATVAGTVNYTVQHTYDDPYGTPAKWFNHATLAAQTADGEGAYTAPVRGIRLTVNSGTGAVVLKLVQAGLR